MDSKSATGYGTSAKPGAGGGSGAKKGNTNNPCISCDCFGWLCTQNDGVCENLRSSSNDMCGHGKGAHGM